MRARSFPGLAAAVAAIAMGAPLPALAQPATPAPAIAIGASLNITPKRLTFDRTRRNGSIVLLNQGGAPVTVDIGLVDRVMLPDGQIFAVEDADRSVDGKAATSQLKSAKDLLQVSPRRAVLQPGRPQTVRVRVSALPEGASGEYRTHLTVTTIPPRDTGATAEAAAAGATPNELRFQITKDLSIATFCDASDVSRRTFDIRVSYLHLSCGPGVRYDTPVGPIRADIGVRIPGAQVPGGKSNEEHVPVPLLGLPVALAVGIGEAY